VFVEHLAVSEKSIGWASYLVGKIQPRILPLSSPDNFQGGHRPAKSLILLVGAARFELATPSPPDWCANRAALRSDRENPLIIGSFRMYRVRLGIAIAANRGRKVPQSVRKGPR
jgi:hypothetical protein